MHVTVTIDDTLEPGVWYVHTTYPDGMIDEVMEASKAAASMRKRRIETMTRLTDNEDLISLVATGSLSLADAARTLRALSVMKGYDDLEHV